MGANKSTIKEHVHLYDTPPKKTARLLYDPRSPNEAIHRTPIQIDGPIPVLPLKMYNHVNSPIVGPNLPLLDENEENQLPSAPSSTDSDAKRSSGVEPTLDPTTVLTALVANNNGKLPPYQL